MNVLGVQVDNYSKKQVLEKVTEFLLSNKQNKIFTPNPEMLVDAQKDEYFKTVLNSGDFNVCDGFGLQLVSGVKRYPGIELMLDVCKLAEEKNKSVYLLGSGSDEITKDTADELKNRFPNLKVCGMNKGPNITYHISHITYQNDNENEEIVHNIIMSAPDILFVAFGHGKQEKWIYENLKDLPSVKISMGVGGSFDFISGKVKRAPRLMRKIGLEWVYRLVCQPWRFGRIWKATVVFIFYFIRSLISDRRSV
ncbi:MAG TPA: glycosyltransferase [Candidatus Magasanikbacteria bacterium]|nr:glycosyltransferase [Candidatus Magasanikbacteria bacterium]